MGGGAGHIADMVARYKTNMSMLAKKRYFNKKALKHDIHEKGYKMPDQHSDPLEMERLHKKLMRAKRIENFEILIILIAGLIVGYGLLYLIFF